MNKIIPSFFAILDLNIFGPMYNTLLFWINLHIYRVRMQEMQKKSEHAIVVTIGQNHFWFKFEQLLDNPTIFSSLNKINFLVSQFNENTKKPL
jgi:hypothetical protein